MTAPTLVSWLVQKAFLMGAPEADRCCDYGNYEVHTQVALRGGGRPDLEVRFRGQNRPAGRLFCESKILASFTDLQEAGYPALTESSRIIVLSPSGKQPPVAIPKFVAASWVDIARAVDEIGRKWGGLAWRTRAVRPDASGQYRVLHELLGYLEREENLKVSVTRPITGHDLGVLAEAVEADERWTQLRRAVRAEAKARCPQVSVEKKLGPRVKGEQRFTINATLRQGHGWDGAGWPAMSRALKKPKESWQQLLLSADASRMSQDVPFAAVGVGLYKPPDWDESDSEWMRLREVIDEAGAWRAYTDREKIYRVLMVRPLAELLSEDETLEGQARAVVSWAFDALDHLVALPSASEAA